MSVYGDIVEIRCELDSHADTCAFGKHCLVLATYSETLTVSGFDPTLGTIPNVKLAKVAVAYDCPLSLHTYLLIFDQVLYMPTMEHHLLCVDQMRDNGIVVNEEPLQRLKAEDRNENSHCILEGTSGLRIPMRFSKPISFFECRKPSLGEVEDDLNNILVEMTNSVPWVPYDEESTRLEDSLRQSHEGEHAWRLSSVSTTVEKSESNYNTVCPSAFPLALGDRVQATLSGVKSSDKSHLVQPDQLAKFRCGRRALLCPCHC